VQLYWFVLLQSNLLVVDVMYQIGRILSRGVQMLAIQYTPNPRFAVVVRNNKVITAPRRFVVFSELKIATFNPTTKRTFDW
jgi:hypothetical protein